MANYTERMVESSRELGRANLVIIELARRHCLNMQFTEWGGRGMVEEMTGLPVNSRRVSCPYALGHGAAMNLEWVATDFYNENCVGCGYRRPTGEMPNLASVIEEKKALAKASNFEATERLRRQEEEWESRRTFRMSLSVGSDPAMESALDDLASLDMKPGSTVDTQAREGARRRLIALAERAPQTFSAEVVDHAIELVESLNLTDLLDPLRILARSRNSLARRVLLVALHVLRTGSNTEAGAVVAELATKVREQDLSSESVTSIVLLAAAPRDRFSWAGSSRTNDPAALRAVADAAPGIVRDVLKELIPQPEHLPSLVIPGRERELPVSGDTPGDYLRASASNAVGLLASTHPSLSEDLVDHLLLSLSVDSEDFHEDEPIHAATHALATIFVLGLGDLSHKLESAGRLASEETRDRLFDVYEIAARLIDPHERWREPGDAQLGEDARRAVYRNILDVCLVRVGGDWGTKVGFAAADVVSDLAALQPAWASEHVDGLLGAFLNVLDQLDSTVRNRHDVVDQTPPEFKVMAEASRRMSVGSTARELLDAIEACALAEPRVIARRLTDLMGEERASERGVETRWRALPRLGSIGRRHGGSPGVLNEILPVLHGYLVDSEPGLRSAALNAWVDIASEHSLPSSVADLLPALIEDRHLVVIEAVLRAARRLDWSEDDLSSLLPYAFFMCAIADAQANTDVLKSAMSAVAVLSRGRVDLHLRAERLILSRAFDLDGFDLENVLRRDWLPEVDQSPEMAALRLRLARDPRINDRLNQHDDEELCALLDTGAGLLSLPLSELTAAALELGPEYVLAAAEFAEVLWRAGRSGEAALVMREFTDALPDEPAYRFHRVLSQLIAALAEVDAAAADGMGIPTAINRVETLVRELDGEEGQSIEDLLWQVGARLTARSLLLGDMGSNDPNWTRADPSEYRSQQAGQLRAIGKSLGKSSQRLTATGTYMRAVSATCEVVAHLADFDAAELRADPIKAEASLNAAKRRAGLIARTLDEKLGEGDPLGGPLIEVLNDAQAIEAGSDVDPILEVCSKLPMPLLIVEGPKRRRVTSTESSQGGTEVLDEQLGVAIVFVSIDGRLVTGPQVLQPGYVYSVELEVQPGDWPDWAERLDAEFLGHLTPSEISLPSFSWKKSDTTRQDGILTASGSMVLRFSLPAGRPASPFRIRLHWRGTRDGEFSSEELEIAGHRQIRVRPFDHSRDYLTDYPIFDERLLELYERFHSAGYDEAEIQAFCRLLTAICRAGLRMTWEKDYKRGTEVTERQFQENLHERLLADPELDGRVEREVPLGLGYADIWHDGIAAELKVERRSAVTEQTAPRYMGQATQYASAQGSRLSILCILDMSPKELPIGTPENYLFTLQPSLHGLHNPEAPSHVATLVVNGNLPPPSSWSK